MQNSWSYEDEAIDEKTLLVSEENEKYISYLEAATDRYIAQLRDIEHRCVKQDGDAESIMQELTVLNDSILDVCERFEEIVKNVAAIKAARFAFRDKTEPIFSNSYGMNRARTWPQGYQAAS